MEQNIQAEGFGWNETWYHVQVHVPVDRNKKIKVSIDPRHLAVLVGGQAVLEGELQDHVYPDESTWYFEDNVLVVELCKRRDDKLWKRVFTSQPFNETYRIEGKRYSEMDKHSEEYRHVQEAFQLQQQIEDQSKDPNYVTGYSLVEEDENGRLRNL